MKNRRCMGVIGRAALLLFFFTQVAFGQETKGDFTVSGSGTSSFAENILTVSGGEVTVSTNETTSQTIKLTGGKLILDGVNIEVTSGDVSPIEVEGEAEINLAAGKTNTLTSRTKSAAGIHVPPGSTVEFTGGGELTADTHGGYSSCGIGGSQGTYSCGTIIFNLDGSVTASGGDRAAGIGTCMDQSADYNASGSIQIKKGTITATGGVYAAGIGAGPDGGTGGGVMVAIEGGTVNATGGEFGSGIGLGYGCDTPVNIFLLGGTVNATGGRGCSGIGSGYDSNAPVDIFLLGGTVNGDIRKGEYASSLNTVIVGPDVVVNSNIDSDYTNGFIFSSSPSKAATVKGNPVFPAGKEMTIDNGETLTIPGGTTLVNNGLIVNNGTITNDGTINGTGVILGATPSGWSGNTAFITYDANGGSGTVATTYHTAGNITSFPAVDGLSREGYTCIGWNSDQRARTALESYTVVSGAYMLYAVWAINMDLSYNNKSITGKVGEAFTGVDLSDCVSNKDDVDGVTFTVGTLPDGFSLAEDGTLTGPTLLTTAMSNKTVTVTVTPNNGADPKDLTLTFKIDKKELVVTPDAGQFVYAGETGYAPTYTCSGALDGQTPAFAGKLSWTDATGNQEITQGTLHLTDNDPFKADNYKLELASPPVTIRVLEQSLEQAYAEAAETIAATVGSDWHNQPITLSAPQDFKLKAVSDLRATSGWEDELTISKEGTYDFKYQLLRDGREESSASTEQQLSIQLDQTAPEITGEPAISNLTATFTLTDATSGIASYNYVLDGAQPAVDVPVTASPNELPVEVSAAAGVHTIDFTIKDVAGNETATASINFTLIAPAPAPDPAPSPSPQPTYYTVTLPEVEGVITNPVAGDYEIQQFRSFSFRLTLAEGYANDSQPVVTTNRGETVEPRQSDGAYLIEDVEQDVVISISGIVPDIPTGIVDLAAGTRIYVAGGTLLISVSQASDAFITDTSGRMLRALRLVPGTTRIEGLHSGVYIVKIDGREGRKVIIR